MDVPDAYDCFYTIRIIFVSVNYIECLGSFQFLQALGLFSLSFTISKVSLSDSVGLWGNGIGCRSATLAAAIFKGDILRMIHRLFVWMFFTSYPVLFLI